MRRPALLAAGGSSLPALGEVLDFLRLLWSVDHALHRTSRRMETTLGVTASQRLVIRIVGRFPGIPAGKLAKLLHVHPGTLTGLVQRIARQGLIRRRSDPDDGRRSLVELTEKGRLFDLEVEGTVEAAIHRVLKKTPSEKICATRDVLEALARELERSSTLLRNERRG